jgi:2-keto-4-pentenoate hydratase/2-oxohepta-3-ene-1,7-dioic acid hydratase in catechol pathway
LDYKHRQITGEEIPLSPGKIICIGRNYLQHIEELDNCIPTEPLLFIKPSTALCNISAPVNIPKNFGPCHNELEIAVLIKKPLRRCTADQALSSIWGVGLGLDLTLRDVQTRLKNQGHPWERAKAFDNSCPMSPFISLQKIDNLADIGFSLGVNNQLRQQGNSRDMLISILDLLVDISNTFTLLAGDVVMTGTPKGVAPLNANDVLKVEMTGHFRLKTSVC